MDGWKNFFFPLVAFGEKSDNAVGEKIFRFLPGCHMHMRCSTSKIVSALEACRLQPLLLVHLYSKCTSIVHGATVVSEK
jgi:hypothetical protein